MIDILHNAEWRVICGWSSDYCIVCNMEIGSGRPDHSGVCVCVPLSVSITKPNSGVCVWVFLDLQSDYNNSITG